MKSVWFVESGSYSDYGVDYVCVTEEIANTLAEKINKNKSSYSSSSFVREVPVVESLEEVQEHLYWFATVDKDGNEHTNENKDPVLMMLADITDDEYAFISTTRKGKSVVSGAAAYSDRSYDVALKAARDKLYQAKAELEGL